MRPDEVTGLPQSELTSRTDAGTVPRRVSQGALSQKQNPGLAEPWGNPAVAFLLFLHSLCFDNEMIVWILQEVIISMGTEPVLAQRSWLARAKISEVMDKLPISENPSGTPRPPSNLIVAGCFILKDKLQETSIGWEGGYVWARFNSGLCTIHPSVSSFVCRDVVVTVQKQSVTSLGSKKSFTSALRGREAQRLLDSVMNRNIKMEI